MAALDQGPAQVGDVGLRAPRDGSTRWKLRARCMSSVLTEVPTMIGRPVRLSRLIASIGAALEPFVARLTAGA